MPIVEELLKREPYGAPGLWMDPEVTDFYAFTKNSFRLENYRCHELDEKIEVAV